MARRSIFALLLSSHDAFALVQNCIWNDGSAATNYMPCDPTAATGTCCLQGEACLESGLCYGGAGLVYRGACINQWSFEACLTYCDSSVPTWANIYPCSGGLGASGADFFWCGNGSQTTCSQDSGTVLKISPGDPIKLLPLANAVSSSTSSVVSSSSTGSVSETAAAATTSSTSSSPTVLPAAQTTCHSGNASCPVSQGTVTAVGAGVGIPLGLAAVALLALYLNERRLRKRSEATMSQAAPALAYAYQGYQAPVTELPAKSYGPFEVGDRQTQGPKELVGSLGSSQIVNHI